VLAVGLEEANGNNQVGLVMELVEGWRPLKNRLGLKLARGVETTIGPVSKAPRTEDHPLITPTTQIPDTK